MGALVLRWVFRSGSAAPRRESAEEILKLRLAKGEINKEQYEEALRLVRGQKTSATDLSLEIRSIVFRGYLGVAIGIGVGIDRMGKREKAKG